MCMNDVEVEKRQQDSAPRFVIQRPTPQITQVEEWVRERRNSETIIMPISASELYGRHNWMPDSGPLIIEISPPHSPRNRASDIEIGCGAVFVIVEDNVVKKRSCRHRHRCQKCRDRLGKAKSEQDFKDRKDEKSDHQGQRSEKKGRHNRRHHEAKGKPTLQDIIGRIVDLLHYHGDRNEEVRRLRVELQKIKAEEKSEGRQLEHIERLLEDVAASPLLSSPRPDDEQHKHPHLRHHEPACGCHHCHPPRAPPSTPSVWQGPYGCEPPPFSIPAGKRTRKHHKHRERDEKRRRGPWQSHDNSLTNSTITDGSGSSSSSRASRIARESFDRVRNFAMRQGRKLKEMDVKIDAARQKIDHVDAKAERTEKYTEKVVSGLEEVHAELHKTKNRVVGTETGLKTVDNQVQGLGLRLDDGLARGEVLGAQMKQVEARSGMNERHTHQLDSKVEGLAAQNHLQREDTKQLDAKLVGLAVQTEIQREDARKLSTQLGGLAVQTESQREDASQLAARIGGLAAQTDVQRQKTAILAQRVGSVEQELDEQNDAQRQTSLALTRRVDVVEQDLDQLSDRQQRDERRNEARWRYGRNEAPNRGHMPGPWQWRFTESNQAAQGSNRVEVEFEEEIDVERIERVRRHRSRSREGRWGRRSPVLVRDSERPMSYTRRRMEGRQGDDDPSDRR